MAKHFLQKFVIFSMITDFFLGEKWGILEGAMRYVCKNIFSLDWLGSIRFVFIKLLINEESFEKGFSFPFLVKYFDRNVKYLF